MSFRWKCKTSVKVKCNIRVMYAEKKDLFYILVSRNTDNEDFILICKLAVFPNFIILFLYIVSNIIRG